jgi:transposase
VAKFKQRLTDDQIRLIGELWQNGTPVRDIAAAVGTSERTVSTYRQSLGLPLRREDYTNPKQKKIVVREELRAMIRKNIPRVKIAQHYGVSLKTLTNYKKALGITEPFTTGRTLTINEIEEELPRLSYVEGKTSREIAEYFGVSRWAVKHWLRALRHRGGRISTETEPVAIDPNRLNYGGRTVPVERRKQMIEEVNQGETLQAVAARHGVHPETISRWRRLYERTGSLHPRNLRRLYLIEPEEGT